MGQVNGSQRNQARMQQLEARASVLLAKDFSGDKVEVCFYEVANAENPDEEMEKNLGLASSYGQTTGVTNSDMYRFLFGVIAPFKYYLLPS
eukprot:CAMPEP_0117687586 /NCGR_PEP_ID=MMETSP0804-20121206/23228_1 /TAXON_ID=1074897 /ORGANISM="Tetraselmis astigmatica, Strain CCMP880" /LENGTH=90 /DNA_ID=CAMNT_0005499687 /DNA_START=20 /DNA_END=289 /DNA_ORIENTATION=-